MKQYNLTFWQRFWLWHTWIIWATMPEDERKKTFHLVKKGMEKHEHRYTIPEVHRGYHFLHCDHEGCNMAIDNDPRLLLECEKTQTT